MPWEPRRSEVIEEVYFETWWIIILSILMSATEEAGVWYIQPPLRMARAHSSLQQVPERGAAFRTTKKGSQAQQWPTEGLQ